MTDEKITRIKNTLQYLWGQRENREDTFGELVGILQGLFVGLEADGLPDKQIRAINIVVERVREFAQISDEDFREAMKTLNTAGCDVYGFIR